MDLAAEDSWQLEWGERVYFSHLTVHTAGVATLFSPGLWPEVLGVAKAVPGCLLHLWVRTEGLMVNLINVHAPTSGPERLKGHLTAAGVHAGGHGPPYTVPDWTIFDNLYLVRDLLELGCRDGLSFALLSLDQEKAFNRVDHGYLLGTLLAFSFGPQFVGFLRVLYASAECLFRLNWTLTKLVRFRCGVCQGCPLSDQLYALAIKPFLCVLHRRLTGLGLWEQELRLVLSAYTDDVLLMVQDPGHLVQVEACQAIYLAASSTWVNWIRSSGLVVGVGWQASSLPPALQAIW
ncbi:unnamed protein product [Caretta caretta]